MKTYLINAIAIVLLSACQSSQVQNSSSAQHNKHYVVLVSLDGFRYDYAQRDGAQNILALGAEGASAPHGMVPSFPSKTFPNHYTLVTGLYPGHHGIVANSFYDPAREQSYSMSDPVSGTDGSWYGGTPLWVLAEQQGMRSACFFWPGSEAEIQGVRPSYYVKYDDKFPNDKRVEQVLQWLQLPEDQRPHFITLYFSGTDDAGHKFGPESRETSAAVREVDQRIGQLRAGLKASHLPVDLIVLADHGMVQLNSQWIYLNRYLGDTPTISKTQGTSFYPKNEAEAEAIYKQLKDKDPRFTVYRRSQLPPRYHLEQNARAGDPIVVANGPFAIRMRPQSRDTGKGDHGFDPLLVPEMKAAFFAAGPDIRAGVVLPEFPNVDVTPFIAHILDLDLSKMKTRAVDGNLEILQRALAASL